MVVHVTISYSQTVWKQRCCSKKESDSQHVAHPALLWPPDQCTFYNQVREVLCLATGELSYERELTTHSFTKQREKVHITFSAFTPKRWAPKENSKNNVCLPKLLSFVWCYYRGVLFGLPFYQHAQRHHRSEEQKYQNNKFFIKAKTLLLFVLNLRNPRKLFLMVKMVKRCAIKMAKAFGYNSRVKIFESVSFSCRKVTRCIFDLQNYVEGELKMLLSTATTTR